MSTRLAVASAPVLGRAVGGAVKRDAPFIVEEPVTTSLVADAECKADDARVARIEAIIGDAIERGILWAGARVCCESVIVTVGAE